MSKYLEILPKKFTVGRLHKGGYYQVYEYFYSMKEAKAYIKCQRACTTDEWEWAVGRY